MIDAGVVDRVILAFGRNVLVSPERAHHRNLLHGSATATPDIFVQADELGFVPADASAKPQALLAQQVRTGGLFRELHGLALRHDQCIGGKCELRHHAGNLVQ